MANKKINEFVYKSPVSSDLIFIGDPSTGAAYKATVADISGAGGVMNNVTYSTNTTASGTDVSKLVFLNATSGNVTYTISPSTFNNAKLQIYGITGGAYTISLAPSSGTIGGNPSYQLLNGECVTVYSNGTNLFIINKN